MLRILQISTLLLLIFAADASAQRRATPPRRGAMTAPTDGLDKLAIDAIASGKLKDFTESIRRQLEPLLAKSNPSDLDRIIRLSAFREFGRRFSLIEKPTSDQIQTLQWLAAKPQLLGTLSLAMSDADQPEKVLEILKLLRTDQQDRLEEFPDLTTALCVVWDQPSRQAHGVVEAEPMVKDRSAVRALMQFYVNGRKQFRFDTSELPWQLAAYLVDNLASPDEIAWAMDRYGGRNAIGNVFFDVQYDYEAYRGTSGLKLNGNEYTLQNILRLGGICGDQAYFAAQVSRSIGIPATIVTGKTSEAGEGHAWVGYLDTQAGHVVWNFEEGRYPIYQFWKGDVVDPQTRDKITDADVSLLAELQNSSQRDRLASAALSRAADLVEPVQQGELYMRAVNLCPGNRRAWMELSALAAQVKLDLKQVAALNAAVSKFALKQYPDFAYQILMRAISGRGTAQRMKAMDDMRMLFASRPDLQAAIVLEQGDLYRQQKQPNQALAAYGEVIQRNTNVAPVVLETMQRIDRMLRDSRNLPQLADAYEIVWQRMPVPEATVIIRATPYFRIGQNYEKLLRELGDDAAAQQVREKLDAMSQTVTVIRERN